jgi:hypothetical protein
MEPNAGMAPNTLIHLAGIIKALRQRGVFLYDPKAGRKCFYVGQPILQLFASRGKKGGAHSIQAFQIHLISLKIYWKYKVASNLVSPGIR